MHYHAINHSPENICEVIFSQKMCCKDFDINFVEILNYLPCLVKLTFVHY